MFNRADGIPNLWPKPSELSSHQKSKLSTLDIHYGAEVSITNSQEIRMVFREQRGVLVGVHLPDYTDSTPINDNANIKFLVYLPEVKIRESRTYALSLDLYRRDILKVKPIPWEMRVFSEIVGTVNIVDLIDM